MKWTCYSLFMNVYSLVCIGTYGVLLCKFNLILTIVTAAATVKSAPAGQDWIEYLISSCRLCIISLMLGADVLCSLFLWQEAEKTAELLKTGGGPPPASCSTGKGVSHGRQHRMPYNGRVQGAVRSDPGGSSMSTPYVQGNSIPMLYCLVCGSHACLMYDWKGYHWAAPVCPSCPL